jgi:hypothetical protein
VAGALALNKRSELESACSGGVCPPGERDTLEAYHRLGVTSGIGFGVALLGIGTGITLIMTSQDEGPSGASKRGRGLSPYVGLGTIGVSGRY